jgi:predicted NAD-dependent protein-ADP-ribosyltransferase YbiA (DUF1768 family)
MDISSKAPWPANELSNFAAHDFIFEDEACASMEGFLQSLKFEDEDAARAIRALSGYVAKARGAERNSAWQAVQTLWWKGWALERGGLEYQALLQRAFTALYTQNAEARSALVATKAAELTHSIGVSDREITVLTSWEFCLLLMNTRGHFAGHYLQFFEELPAVASRLARYRRGGRRAARRRQRDCITCLDLVSLVGYGGPSRIDFSKNIASYNSTGGIAGCDGTIALDVTASLYDQAYIYAHEAGHIFDMAFLSDELRGRFAGVLGRTEVVPGDSWTGGGEQYCLQEAFADAYARLSCTGTWRNEYYANRYWDQDRDEHVLRAAFDIVEQARWRMPVIEVRAGGLGASWDYVPTSNGRRNERSSR